MEEGLPFEFEKEKFHTIISTYALHHVTDRKKLNGFNSSPFRYMKEGQLLLEILPLKQEVRMINVKTEVMRIGIIVNFIPSMRK